jgi:hypothetical protein
MLDPAATAARQSYASASSRAHRAARSMVHVEAIFSLSARRHCGPGGGRGPASRWASGRSSPSGRLSDVRFARDAGTRPCARESPEKPAASLPVGRHGASRWPPTLRVDVAIRLSASARPPRRAAGPILRGELGDEHQARGPRAGPVAPCGPVGTIESRRPTGARRPRRGRRCRAAGGPSQDRCANLVYAVGSPSCVARGPCRRVSRKRRRACRRRPWRGAAEPAPRPRRRHRGFTWETGFGFVGSTRESSEDDCGPGPVKRRHVSSRSVPA